MTKTKAVEIVGILVDLDYPPIVRRSGPDDFTLTVADSDGVGINALKNFQDNNNVTCKSRVTEIS